MDTKKEEWKTVSNVPNWKEKLPNGQYRVHLDMENTKTKARRYSTGKLRYDLIPVDPLKYVAEVYTRGAHKHTLYKKPDGTIVDGKDITAEEASKYEIYDDGANNWRKGMNWSETMAAVIRHCEQWRGGEELDDELKTKHLANAVWGLLALMEYERTYPQGDNRPHKYLHYPKIGLDIDEVLCDFVGGWCERHQLVEPESWHFDYPTSEWARFKDVDKEDIENFYKNLKPKVKASDIPFEPHCYITSRSMPTELTKKWLQDNGFATVPVYTVQLGESKIEVAKKAGIEWFIDDRFENFVELNKAGICTFLWDAPWNRRYDVGYKRVMNFEDFKKRFL